MTFTQHRPELAYGQPGNPLLIVVTFERGQLFTDPTEFISAKGVASWLRSKRNREWLTKPGTVHARLSCEVGEYRVILQSQACNFGRVRWWFECPCCRRRVYALFWRDRHFACRICQDVRYVCNTWSDPYRLERHYAGLRERLRHRPGPKPIRILIRSWKYQRREERAFDKYCARSVKLIDRLTRGSMNQ